MVSVFTQRRYTIMLYKLGSKEDSNTIEVEVEVTHKIIPTRSQRKNTETISPVENPPQDAIHSSLDAKAKPSKTNISHRATKERAINITRSTEGKERNYSGREKAKETKTPGMTLPGRAHVTMGGHRQVKREAGRSSISW